MQKHVRVITPIRPSSFRHLSDFDIFQRPDLKVDHSFIADGPDSIESRYEETLALVPTIHEIVRAEREGADAVVVDCMGDPGVESARELVRIPVVGPARVAVHLATMLGVRFGVVSVLDRLEPLFVETIEACGQMSRYAGTRSVDIPVLDLERMDPAALHAGLVDCALELVGAGADVIIFGCTGMLGCAEGVRAGLLKQGIDVPVIDPVPLAIHVAAGLVDAGLSHSARCYAPPKTVVPATPDPSVRCA